MTRSAPIHTRRPRPAFTLVEIMIVVAIIGILATLLVIGVGKLSENAKRQQTRAILEQCRALYTNWQTVAHQPFAPSGLPLPTADMSGSTRYANDVWFTRDLMAQFRTVPANAAAIAKLPAASLMTIPAATAMPFNPTLWSAFNAYTPFNSDGTFGRVYIIDPTNFNTHVFYQCIQYVPASANGSNPLPAQDRAHWVLSYPVTTNDVPGDASVPLPLDAWGNPILFVPGGSFGGLASSPDGRPYFVSAGPDGNFATGNDNLYSFEK